MLRHARTAAAARIAAALVAVTLSGAPRVLATHAPVEGHRCACREHAADHHECDCAICRKAALAARASDESLPPCHRDAARKALARTEPAGRRGDAPCVEGTCGSGGRQAPIIPGVEPFCLPASGAPATELAHEACPRAADRLGETPAAPEPPPPRPA